MATIITKNGFDNLSNDLRKLIQVDRVEVSQLLADTRPFGASDEFPPEYMQALDIQNRLEKKIADMQDALSDCIIFDKCMIKKTDDGQYKVGFGATVSIVNCETDKEVTYTLVSKYESDVSKGLISIEAPISKEMMGLKIGDWFELNETDFVISNINYLL